MRSFSLDPDPDLYGGFPDPDPYNNSTGSASLIKSSQLENRSINSFSSLFQFAVLIYIQSSKLDFQSINSFFLQFQFSMSIYNLASWKFNQSTVFPLCSSSRCYYTIYCSKLANQSINSVSLLFQFAMLSGQAPFYSRTKVDTANTVMRKIKEGDFRLEGEAWR